MNDNIITFLIFSIFLLVLGTSGYFVKKYKCSVDASMMETEYRYEIVAGCYIKKNGKYIPIERLREID